MLTRWALVVMLVAMPAAAQAHEGLMKDSPKLITTQGAAKRAVPVDKVRILLSFVTERGTFGEAGKEGIELVEALQKRLANVEGPTLVSVYGWDLLKQAKISLTTKGRRIDHNLAIELEGIPPGRLHDLVGRVIDQALEVGGRAQLEVQSIEVDLSDAVEQQVRAELMAKASELALAQAKGMAEAAGAQIAGPRYLFANPEYQPMMDMGAEGGFAMMAQRAMPGVAVRKSFRVQAEVPDTLELSVSVVGVFELQ
jgi:uncharacterized protein YggE